MPPAEVFLNIGISHDVLRDLIAGWLIKNQFLFAQVVG
jgi:hypothetical protein